MKMEQSAFARHLNDKAGGFLMNQQDNHYRLHHLPFMVMWVASFGVAWLGVFFSGIILSDLRYNVDFVQVIATWLDANRWLYGLLLGTGIGTFLALIQPWLIRWRYGFVPRFWRIATFFGAILAGSLFSEYFYGSGYSFNYANVWGYLGRFAPISVWFGTLGLVQMLALWPVARRAWLYPLGGIGASLIAFGTGFWNGGYGLAQMNMLFFGSFAQAVFSGALFLWLMRDYRVEAVPKRDEKSKGLQRRGLHPISFIGLWMMAHLFGWVALLSVVFVLILASSAFSPVQSFMNWLGASDWSLAVLLGLIVGGVTSIAQRWLIQQQSEIRPRFWMLLSLVAWSLAGLGLWQFMDSYNGSGFWHGTMLVVWFGLPTILQSLALWPHLRSAWLYGLAGIVSALIAYLIYEQFSWAASEQIYTVIFGAIVQAILTGVAFLIMNQTQPHKATDAVVVPQEASIPLSD
jgi:hypothetical protein